MNKKQLVIGAGLTALVSSPQAQCAAVSVVFNNTGNDNADRFFMPGDVAGVVPLANWNNADLVIAGNAAYGPFRDDNGRASTLAVGATTGGTPDTWNTWDGDFNRNINADWANGLTQMVLSAIPYTSYDLIIYAGANFGNDTTDITVGGTTIRLDDTTGGNPNRTPALTSGIDYVTFSGLSGATQTVDFANVAGGIGVGGFQVVEAIPEPSGALLAIIAAGFAGLRRRR